MATFNSQEIGEIIVLAGAIEEALRMCGGKGNGLRELSDSLGNRLTPDIRALLSYIGMIRNHAAHEGLNAQVNDWQPTFFAEACEAVLNELERLSTARPQSCKKIVSDPIYEEESAPPTPESPLPWEYLSIIPGLHILYPFGLLRDAFSEVGWAMFGLFNYAMTGVLIYISITFPIVWGYIPAGIFFASAILVGAEYKSYKLRFIPLVNLIVFGEELVRKTEYVKLLCALTLWAIPLISFKLIFISKELLAGITLAIIGYITGMVIAFTLKRN